MRKAILWLVGIAALVLLTTRTAEIIALADTVRSGSFLLLLAAILLQVGRHLMTALSYSQAFLAVGVETRTRQFIPVVFGAIFMNTIMPTGGTAGPVLIIDDARRRGVPAGRATSAMLLSQVAYFAGFAVIMSVGFVILWSTGRLGSSEFVAGLILIGVLALFSGLLVMGKFRPALLGKLMGGIERAVERLAAAFSRPAPRKWSTEMLHSFSEASEAIWDDPKGIGRVIGCATGGHALDLATFMAVGFAFGFTEIGPLTAGFVVAILLTVISVVPQGVGIVEAGVALLLTSYGVQGTIATAISLVFRGIVFWLPVGIGAVLLRRTRSFSVETAEIKEGTRRFTGLLAAILAAALGGATIINSVLPHLPEGLSDVTGWVPPAPPLSTTSALVAGFALFFMARGLWRRTYLAWAFSLFLLLVTSVLLLLSGALWQSVAAPLVFALWLYTERAVFDQHSDPVTVSNSMRAAGIAAAATLAYGTLGFWALEHQFELRYGLGQAFRQTLGMFVNFLNTGIVPTSGHGEWFVTSVYVVGIASALAVIAVAVSPVVLADYEEWKTRHDKRRGGEGS